jgi:hypothetical protein
MTKIKYAKIGPVKDKKGNVVKTKKGKPVQRHRVVYEMPIPPKLKTAYRYFVNAYIKAIEETNEEKAIELKKQADREMHNVYKVAFSK